MPKKRIAVMLAMIAALIIAVSVLTVILRRKTNAEGQDNMLTLTVWQIDGFEGGRGARSQFIKTAGGKCFKGEKTYLNVVSLTANAARENLARGEMPEMISYPAGFYGIDNIINRKDYAFKTWCRGGYCLLTVDESADFSDCSAENTVINAGKDNLSSVAAVMCGLSGAQFEEPTTAYLKLINGKCKYLLGTQRDVFRLKTRGVSFSVKPIAQFNDLYQNISILTVNSEKYNACSMFVNYLTVECDMSALGLFGVAGGGEYAEELIEMKNTHYESILNYPCGKGYIDELKTAAQNCDINKIKTLLK